MINPIIRLNTTTTPNVYRVKPQLVGDRQDHRDGEDHRRGAFHEAAEDQEHDVDRKQDHRRTAGNREDPCRHMLRDLLGGHQPVEDVGGGHDHEDDPGGFGGANRDSESFPSRISCAIDD